MSVVFLLAGNLRVNMAEHASPTRACSATSLLEPLKLDDEDLGHRVDLKLLSDISVLSTDIAIPLVISRQCLLLRIALEASAKVETLISS